MKSLPSPKDRFLEQPPFSLEAEVGIIGCILVDQSLFVKAKRFINEFYFYSDKNRIIFKSFDKLAEEKKDIDQLTVANKLKEMGRYDYIGPSYLFDVVNSIQSVAIFESYLQILMEKWKARMIQKLSYQLYNSCKEEHFSDIIIEEFKSQIDKVCNSVKSENIYRFGEGLQDFIKDIEDRRALYLNGVPYTTTIRDLDRATGGIEKKSITVIGSKSSIGKTSLATQIAYALASRSLKILYFTTEMPEKEIRNRIICSELNLNYFNVVRKGIISDEEKQSVLEMTDKVRGIPLHIYFKPGLTYDIIRNETEKEKADFVFVDYLQQMKIKGKDRPDREIAEICNNLKEMAGDCNCGVVILSQFSRQFDKSDREKPKLSDLKESGGIEIAADLVLLLHRHKINYEPDIYSPEMKRIVSYSTSIIIGKQRNGPSDIEIETEFLVKPMRFVMHTDDEPSE